MIEQLVLIFFLFSFAGWIIEFCFRSIYEKKPVNPGFHLGPWLPLYGFVGIVILFVSEKFTGDFLLIRIFFYLVLCTAFEFFAGVFLERAFHRRYWDYSHNRLNVKGLICPLYSVAWVLISLIVEVFILPQVRENLSAITPEMILMADTVLLFIFIADFIYSSGIIGSRSIARLKGLFNG